MSEDFLRQLSHVVLRPVAVALGRLGVTPNQVTTAGFLFTLAASFLIAQSRLRDGALMLAIGASLDGVDGYLARAVYQESRFGAFLDSMLDRVSETVTYLALMIHYLTRPRFTETILVFVCATVSLLVSYSRARAESLQGRCNIGIATRPIRLMILFVGLFFSHTTTALCVIALLSSITVVQRMAHAWRLFRETPPEERL